MKILHLYKDYFPVLGGIENHVRWLAEAQAARGHDVTVLVTNPAGMTTTIQKENGVQVIRAARLTTVASTPLSLSMPLLLRRQTPDVVHLQFPYPVGETSQWLMRRGRATIISYQSDVVRQAAILKFYTPILKRVLRQADRILASSPNYIQSSPWLRPLAEKCTVVPLGIDLGRFAGVDAASKQQIRQRYPGPLLLFVGRLRYYKGLDDLLRAMQRIEATLLVVGDGPESAHLQALSKKLAVSGKVHFLQTVGDDDLAAYFAAADLFVLPSSHRSEAFGIVLLEAMAAGTPLVTTELGTGTSWVNQDGVTGLVVPPRNAEALAGAINALLQNVSQRADMGARARARAQTQFGLPVLVDRVMKVYESLLRSG